MQNYEKLLVKFVVLSSTIVTGVALKSTNAMAAEMDVENTESHLTELTDETEEMTRNDAIKKLEDACEIVEADAVAEESYLNQAKEAIENNEINPEIVEEVLEGASAVLDQADEQKKNAEEKYNEIIEAKQMAETDFAEVGVAAGFEEYVEACIGTEDNQEKEKMVDEAISKNDDIHDIFLNEHGEKSEEYLATLDEYYDAESEYNKANVEYENTLVEWEEAERAYEDVLCAYQEARDYLHDLENQISDKERIISYSERDHYGWDLRLEWYKDEYDEANALVDKTSKEVEGIQESLEVALKNYEDTKNEDDKKLYEEILDKYNAKCEQLKKQTQDLTILSERYNSYLEEINVWKAEMDVMLEEYKELQVRHEEYSESDEYKNCYKEYSEADRRLKEIDNNKELSYSYLTKKTQEYNVKKENKSKLDAIINEEERRHSSFGDVAVEFKNMLVYSDEANGILKRVEAEYNKVNEVYTNLIDVLFEYQQENKKVVDEVYSSERFNEAKRYIEQSASIGEALVNQTKQMIENGEMTDTIRADLISQAEGILRQAQEQRQSIQFARDDIDNYVQNIRVGFEWYAKRNGLGDYVILLNEADSYTKKIAIIDEMLNRINNNLVVSQMRVASNEVMLGANVDIELGTMFNEIALDYKEALALYNQAEEIYVQSDQISQKVAENVEVIKKIAVVPISDENDSVVDEIVVNVVRIGKKLFGNAFANFEVCIVSTIRCVAGKLSPEVKKCVLDVVKLACK